MAPPRVDRWRVTLESPGPGDAGDRRRTRLTVEGPGADRYYALQTALFHLAAPVTLWRVVDVERLP